MPDEIAPELADALGELHRYLSDELAPLMVGDSLQLLMLQPPEVAAREIQAWLAEQYQGRESQVPVSDFLFHALKKIHLLGELRVIPAAALQGYFEALATLLLGVCPQEDRELLRGNIERIGLARGAASGPVSTLYRQAGGETALATSRPPATAVSAVSASSMTSVASVAAMNAIGVGLLRFQTLLSQLERSAAAGKPADLAPELITAAAAGSRDAEELDRLLRRLRAAGIDVTSKQMFRALGRKLPDWAPPAPARTGEAPGAPGTPETPEAPSGIAGAMRRVISLAPNPAEALARFRELVETAVEQANEGALARAVTMLELAQKILERERIDAAAADAYRSQAHAALDRDALRLATESPEKRPLLRRLLVFFPRLRPRGLMDALRGERKRDARRLWLALLETHGAPAREEVLQELESTLLHGGADWYYQRNLLYAARRIRRSSERFVEAEAGLFERLSDPGLPAALVKEAVANLGLVKHPRSEAILLGRLAQLEGRLARLRTPGTERDELVQLLDRVAAALGRLGTPAAVRAVVERALKPAPGASLEWLEHLAGQDLSGAPDAVDALLKALRGALPGVLGLGRKAAEANVPHLLAALASTPSPVVQEAIADVARRHAGREIGHLAAKALETAASPAPPAAPAASLAGDLELFGLPMLLQTFEQNEATGVLLVKNAHGAVVGTFALEKGMLRRAAAGPLKGPEAVYQLLQRPARGFFAFTHRPELSPEDGPLEAPLPVVPLVLEGMRRYDELERAAVLVPDDVPLRPTRVKPTPDGHEPDPLVLRSVWDRAAAGATAAECEAAARADSYRVRRMLAHWVEEGSLQMATAAS